MTAITAMAASNGPGPVSTSREATKEVSAAEAVGDAAVTLRSDARADGAAGAVDEAVGAAVGDALALGGGVAGEAVGGSVGAGVGARVGAAVVIGVGGGVAGGGVGVAAAPRTVTDPLIDAPWIPQMYGNVPAAVKVTVLDWPVTRKLVSNAPVVDFAECAA